MVILGCGHNTAQSRYLEASKVAIASPIRLDSESTSVECFFAQIREFLHSFAHVQV